MNKRAIALVTFVVICGIAAWIVVLRREHISIAETEQDAPSTTTTSSEPPRLVREVVDGRDASIVLDKAKRDELREKIYRAWGMPVPSERSDPSSWPTGPADSSGFGRDYVQDRIRADYIPLAKDCYEQGLKKNPKLGGKLVANFRIVGSKNTGGLIDWVDTSSEETTLDDKDVLECLTQSLYSVTFDPPPDDGVVTVTYPITFAPDDPDE